MYKNLRIQLDLNVPADIAENAVKEFLKVVEEKLIAQGCHVKSDIKTGERGFLVTFQQKGKKKLEDEFVPKVLMKEYAKRKIRNKYPGARIAHAVEVLRY